MISMCASKLLTMISKITLLRETNAILDLGLEKKVFRLQLIL